MSQFDREEKAAKFARVSRIALFLLYGVIMLTMIGIAVAQECRNLN